MTEKIEFGIYSLGDYVDDVNTGIKVTEQERIEQMIETAKLAENITSIFIQLVNHIKSILFHNHMQ